MLVIGATVFLESVLRKPWAKLREAHLSTKSLPPVNLSSRVYWLAVWTVAVLYFGSWLVNLRYVYGWGNDDYNSFFLGTFIMADPLSIFRRFNSVHAHYALMSLPMRLGVGLESFPMPPLAYLAGVYRFTVLCMIALHAGMLVMWALFAATLVSNRLAALLSVALLALSPTFVFWTPQLDSRWQALPPLLLSLWLLLRSATLTPRSRWRPLLTFLAGSVGGLGLSIHYTGLYLLGPVSLAFWLLWLWPGRQWRCRMTYVALVAFGLGLLWPQVGLELLSLAAGVPFENGPLNLMLWIYRLHASPWSAWQIWDIWARLSLDQFGPLLILASLVGLGLLLWPAHRPLSVREVNLRALGLGVLLALLYLLSGRAMPFLRQTVPLQPVLFLGAGLAILVMPARLLPGRWPPLAVSTVLFVAAAAVPWQQSAIAREAHLGLGHVLEWANIHKQGRPLLWLQVGAAGDPAQILTAEQLASVPDDAWVLSYYPWWLINKAPSVHAYLERVPPLAAAAAVPGSMGAWADLQGFGFDDARPDGVLSEARVLDGASLKHALHGAPLSVRAVYADSQAYVNTEPARVFDHDHGPNDITYWLSADTSLPHWLAVDFAAPTMLGELQVVSSRLKVNPLIGEATRIDALEVQVQDANGNYRAVWLGSDLHGSNVIHARWDPSLVSGVRLIIVGLHRPSRPSQQAFIEELLFPGYDVTLDPSTD